MTIPNWRKSTYSNHERSCVEVAANLPDGIGIRDSKNTSGPTLLVSRESFTNSVRALKARQR